jgi:hypothetical protein
MSGQTITDHVGNTSILNASEEIIQDCNQKFHNYVLKLDSSGLIEKVKNYQADRQRNIGRLIRGRKDRP